MQRVHAEGAFQSLYDSSMVILTMAYCYCILSFIHVFNGKGNTRNSAINVLFIIRKEIVPVC